MSERHEEGETITLTPEERAEAIRRDLPEEAQPFAISYLSAEQARQLEAKEERFKLAYDHIANDGDFVTLRQAFPDINEWLGGEQQEALLRMIELRSLKNGIKTDRAYFNELLEQALNDPDAFCQYNLREMAAGRLSLSDTDDVVVLQKGMRSGDRNVLSMLDDYRQGAVLLERILKERGLNPWERDIKDGVPKTVSMKRGMLRGIMDARSKKDGPLNDEELKTIIDFQLERIPGTYLSEFGKGRRTHEIDDELKDDKEKEVEIIAFLQEQDREVNQETIIEQVRTKEYQTVREAKELFTQLPPEIQGELRQEFMKGEDTPLMQEHLMTIAYLTHLKAQADTMLNTDVIDIIGKIAISKEIETDFNEEVIKKIAGLLGLSTGFVKARLYIDSGKMGERPLHDLFEPHPALKKALADPKIGTLSLNDASNFITSFPLTVEEVQKYAEELRPSEREQFIGKVKTGVLKLAQGVTATRIHTAVSRWIDFEEVDRLIALRDEKEGGEWLEAHRDVLIYCNKGREGKLGEMRDDDELMDYIQATPEERERKKQQHFKGLEELVGSFQQRKETLEALSSALLNNYEKYSTSADPEERKKAEEIGKLYRGTMIKFAIYEGMPEFVATTGLGAVPVVGPVLSAAFSSSAAYCDAFRKGLDDAGIDLSTEEGRKAITDPEISTPIFMNAMKTAFGAGAASVLADRLTSKLAPRVTSSYLGQEVTGVGIGAGVDMAKEAIEDLSGRKDETKMLPALP